MKRGFCYLAECTEPKQALKSVIERFASVGIQLTHPRNGRITHLVGDGEAIQVAEADLVEAVGHESRLTPQFWLGPDTYIACAFRHLGAGIVRHFYSLDGLDAEERGRIVLWAIDYFRHRAREDTAMLMVADPEGRTADVDWDGVTGQVVPIPSTLPYTLGLPSSWAARLRLMPAPQIEKVGRFELLRSRQEITE